MNAKTRDVVTRSLTSAPSRRDVLRGLAGAGLGLGFARLPDPAAAGTKRKRKKRTKVKRNTFGCVNVGGFCKTDEQCCSGICQGKKQKRKCKAHGAGTCDQDGPDLCTTTAPAQVRCNNSDTCACIRTTAGSNFCFDAALTVDLCADCQTDADCAALGFPAGSACAPVLEGLCAGSCEGGMACMISCGNEPPQE